MHTWNDVVAAPAKGWSQGTSSAMIPSPGFENDGVGGRCATHRPAVEFLEKDGRNTNRPRSGYVPREGSVSVSPANRPAALHETPLGRTRPGRRLQPARTPPRMAPMKALESIVVECPGCSRRATVGAETLESRLDLPLSVNSVGQLYRRLRCSACGSREIRIGDTDGRALIDPDAITPCRACGRPIPLPRLEALPDSESLHALRAGRGEAACLTTLPPAASAQAEMSALRGSDDRSPEQRGPGVFPWLHVLSEVPLDRALR